MLDTTLYAVSQRPFGRLVGGDKTTFQRWDNALKAFSRKGLSAVWLVGTWLTRDVKRNLIPGRKGLSAVWLVGT